MQISKQKIKKEQDIAVYEYIYIYIYNKRIFNLINFKNKNNKKHARSLLKDYQTYTIEYM